MLVVVARGQGLPSLMRVRARGALAGGQGLPPVIMLVRVAGGQGHGLLPVIMRVAVTGVQGQPPVTMLVALAGRKHLPSVIVWLDVCTSS